MPGAPDPLYVLARRALLDGLEALSPQLESVVVVGAQAVYEHTGPADLPVAELTTDADVAVSPELLSDTPALTELLEVGNFQLGDDPGSWRTAEGVQFDVLVPEALAGPGRRSARLPGHGRKVARRARGIEGALIDNEMRELRALDPSDPRTFRVAIAGPAALLVAKIHKVAERVQAPDRLVDKDALDILRLLRASSTRHLGRGIQSLTDAELSREVTVEALSLGDDLMGSPDSSAAQMAVRAAGPSGDPQVIANSLALLWSDLREELSNG